MSVQNNTSWHYPLTAHPANAIGPTYRENKWGKKTVIFLANIASLPAQLLGLAIGGTVGGVAAVGWAALKGQSKSRSFREGATTGGAAGVLAFSAIFFPLTLGSLALARAAGNKGVCLRANTLANRVLRKTPDLSTLNKVHIRTQWVNCDRLIDKQVNDADLKNSLRWISAGIMAGQRQRALKTLNTFNTPKVAALFNEDALKTFRDHLSESEIFAVDTIGKEENDVFRNEGLICDAFDAFHQFLTNIWLPS